MHFITGLLISKQHPDPNLTSPGSTASAARFPKLALAPLRTREPSALLRQHATQAGCHACPALSPPSGAAEGQPAASATSRDCE